MSIFNIVKNQPTITPEGVNIPEMLAIWQKDTTPNKIEAKQIYAYIYHMCDPESVYAKKDLNTREQLVIKDYVKDKALIRRKEVKEACEKYKLLNAPITLDFLESVKITLNKLSRYMVDTEITDGKTGNIGDILNVINRGGALIVSYGELVKKVESDLSILKAKKRGDVKVNIFDAEDQNSN